MIINCPPLLVAGDGEQVTPVVGELVHVIEHARRLPQQGHEQPPAGGEQDEEHRQEKQRKHPAPQQHLRKGDTPVQRILFPQTLLRGPRPGRSFGLTTSLLAPGSPLPRPSRPASPAQWLLVRVRSPVTVAGPRRTRTGFLVPVALVSKYLRQPIPWRPRSQ